MGQVSESIFSDGNLTIPLADVQHIEAQIYNAGTYDKPNFEPNGAFVITKHTKWNFENDCWENAIYLAKGEQEKRFRKAWCDYRHELEKDTLMDIANANTV